jgi:hypothetical protein
MRLVIALSFACLFLVAFPATGAEQPASRPSFDSADTNKDRRVSLAEFRMSMQNFLESRAPEGGRAAKLTAQRRERIIERAFSRLDANRDSAVDPAEWEAGLRLRDHDGP